MTAMDTLVMDLEVRDGVDRETIEAVHAMSGSSI